MFSILWRHYLFDRRARIEDWRRVRVEYSRNICIFFPSFSLHICFRLCCLSSRQVRNVGMDRRSILLVTHRKWYFKEKQRTLLRGWNLMTVSHRSHLKQQHLMTRIQPFLHNVHSKLSLRSPRWNMTNKCRSGLVIPSTMRTEKMRRHYGFLHLTVSCILLALGYRARY